MSVIIVFFEVLPMSNITILTTNTTILTTNTTIQLPSLAIIATTMAKMKGLKISNIILFGMKKDTDDHNIASIVYAFAEHKDNNRAGARNEDIIDNRRLTLRNENTKNRKFTHSSIRIEEIVLKTLQEEAQKRGISFNNLVNKTLKNYVTSEMYFEQLGFILVGKDFLRQTFSKVDEKHVEEFGREIGLTIAREYISCFSGEVNSNTLIQFLDIWFRRFEFCQHRVEDLADDINSSPGNEKLQWQKQLHLFTVIHDINLNFSLVLKAILEGLVEPITKSPISFRDITSTSITFLIKV